MEKNKITLTFPRKVLWYLLLLYGIASLYLLFFSPYCGRYPRIRNMNLVPFEGMIHIIRYSGSMDLILMNILGNMLLLFPLGWLWALLSRSNTLTWWKIFLRGALCSLTIELFQWILNLGCLDVDDILLNSLGFFFGYNMGKRWKIPQKSSTPGHSSLDLQ